jgi:hypothetical protein
VTSATAHIFIFIFLLSRAVADGRRPVVNPKKEKITLEHKEFTSMNTTATLTQPSRRATFRNAGLGHRDSRDAISCLHRWTRSWRGSR